MTDKMKELFYRNFSQEGRKNPESRPAMREWFEELRRAQDMLITCEHCQNTYFMRSEKKEECPFCRKMRARSVYYAQILDEYDYDSIVDAENQAVDSFNETGDFHISHLTKEDLKPIRQIGKKIFDDADGTYVFFNYQTDDVFSLMDEEMTIAVKIKGGKYAVYNCTTDMKITLLSDGREVGVLEGKCFKRFDEIDRLVLCMPVNYGRKSIEDDGIHIVDSVSAMRKRYIRFYKL